MEGVKFGGVVDADGVGEQVMDVGMSGNGLRGGGGVCSCKLVGNIPVGSEGNGWGGLVVGAGEMKKRFGHGVGRITLVL